MISRIPRAVLACVCAVSLAGAQDWNSWGGDPGGARFSRLAQINKANVCNLRIAWTYRTGENAKVTRNFNPNRIEPFEATPLVIDGVMYFSTPSGRVISLDAESGRELWQFDPQQGEPVRVFHANRGVSYWQSADGLDRRIIFGTYEPGMRSRLIELDARTGKPRSDFGNRGAVDLRAGTADRWPKLIYAVTSPPAIYKDIAIIGAEVPEFPSRGPSGVVRAFNIKTGKPVWTFHPIPAADDRTGGNVWSIMSVDADRGMVFLPVGSASYDFYGGDRKGSNLYANSLVALDAATGKVIWYYQMVHHDLWDYDVPAQPALITLRRGEQEIPAVAQVTKMGFVFLFDRRTGALLFPVKERAVPQSHVPGESTFATQPFPLLPPALSRQSMSARDITTVTPESHDYCAALYEQLRHSGIYTPYGTTMTLVAAGELGGGNWSGGSFDPGAQRLFVNTNNLFSIGRLKAQPGDSAERYRRTGPDGEHSFFWDRNQLPCQQPPWGMLSAVDLSTGSIAWQIPLGGIEGVAGKTGSPNLGGSIATAGGLVFIGAALDNRFRAFDSATGKELWSAKLEAAAHATPMTYAGRKSGRQYVVVAAGGGGIFRGKVSDTLVAYALPN